MFLYCDLFVLNLANIYSQNERARIESADLCKQLALKCSDSSVISNILNFLFNIYHGSEGKLSTSEQKINILQVILKLELLMYIYIIYYFTTIVNVL